jgi:hypothetical protein
MGKKIGILLFLLTCFSFGSAYAFRCGPNVVVTGDTTVEVVIKCGEPTTKEVNRIETNKRQTGEWKPSRRYSGEVTYFIETWTYNCGPHKFIKILTFRGGILKDIKLGRYGSGESDCLGAKRRQYPKPDLPPPENDVADPSPALVEEYGRISIFGLPHFAEIYLDGEFVGKMPSTVEVIPSGAHVVTVKMADYKDWTKRVIVKSGETLFLEVYLENEW